MSGRSVRVVVVVVALVAGGVLSPAAPAAAADAGGLTQPAGTTGCVGTPAGCASGNNLNGAIAVAIAPGGTHAYAAAFGSNALLTFDRNPSTGALTQRAGTAGCITDAPTAGCADGNALGFASWVTVSPDGKNVYVTAQASNAIAVFDRNTTTGALTQKAGTAGCVNTAGAGGCADGNALDAPRRAVVSADGRNVYVAAQGSDAIAVFDRNTTTGALTQKAGTAGCVNETGTGGCADGRALDGPTSVVVGPGGTHVYVTSFNSDAIAVFNRNGTSGALTQKTGTAGCTTEAPVAGCTDGRALDGALALTVAPGGTHVYAASNNSDAVTTFDRHPTTGVLTQRTGTAGCTTEAPVAGCTDGNALDGANAVAVSPDGVSVYATADTSNSVVVFRRNPTTGALTQRPGTAGCVSETGTGGTCVDGRALSGAIDVTVSQDNADVYVAGFFSNAVAVFDRERPRFCEGRVVTVALGQGDTPTAAGDVILGTSFSETIESLGGNDVVCGAGGSDTIRGGTGNDRLLGQPGNDILLGGSGDDVLLGADGRDALNGGPGRDNCNGGPQSDTAAGCETRVGIP